MNNTHNIYLKRRFDDWQLLLGVTSGEQICFIDISKHTIFNNFKCLNNLTVINDINCFDNKFKENNKFDKIIISDYKAYKNLLNNYHLDIYELLYPSGKIILFKKNIVPYINTHFYTKRLFPKMKLICEYSILPFYNNNPLFFLPIHKTFYIKHSLKIIISTMQTISPEAKNKYGYLFFVVLFLLKQMLRFNLHILLRLFSFGTVTVLTKS